MKHHPTATANALAATTAIIYVVCRGAFVVAPDLTMTIAKSWFHGIDISLIAAKVSIRGHGSSVSCRPPAPGSQACLHCTTSLPKVT
jgi:hypothetical protein